jgi:hypothetical protein
MLKLISFNITKLYRKTYILWKKGFIIIVYEVLNITIKNKVIIQLREHKKVIYFNFFVKHIIKNKMSYYILLVFANEKKKKKRKC